MSKDCVTRVFNNKLIVRARQDFPVLPPLVNAKAFIPWRVNMVRRRLKCHINNYKFFRTAT